MRFHDAYFAYLKGSVSSHEEAELVWRSSQDIHTFHHLCEDFRVLQRDRKRIVKRVIIPIHFAQREDTGRSIIPRAVPGVPHETNRLRSAASALEIFTPAYAAHASVRPEEGFIRT